MPVAPALDSDEIEELDEAPDDDAGGEIFCDGVRPHPITGGRSIHYRGGNPAEADLGSGVWI